MLPSCLSQNGNTKAPPMGWSRHKSNKNNGNVVKCHSLTVKWTPLDSSAPICHVPLMASTGQNEHVKVRMNCFSTALCPSLSQGHRASCCGGRSKSTVCSIWGMETNCFSYAQRGQVVGLNEVGMSCLMSYFGFSWLWGGTSLRAW